MNLLKYIVLVIGISLTVITCTMAYQTDRYVKALDAQAAQVDDARKLGIVNFYLARMKRTEVEMRSTMQDINRLQVKADALRAEQRLRQIVREEIRYQY